MAQSSAPCASPTACAATPGRARSSVIMALAKPRPSASPSRFSAGTLHLRKCSSWTGTQQIPMRSSRLPISNPVAPFSTVKAEIPR